MKKVKASYLPALICGTLSISLRSKGCLLVTEAQLVSEHALYLGLGYVI